MNLSLDGYKSSILKINYQKTSNDTYLKLFDLQSPLLLEDNSVLESIIKLDLEHENYDLTTSVEMYENLNASVQYDLFLWLWCYAFSSRSKNDIVLICR